MVGALLLCLTEKMCEETTTSACNFAMFFVLNTKAWASSTCLLPSLLVPSLSLSLSLSNFLSLTLSLLHVFSLVHTYFLCLLLILSFTHSFSNFYSLPLSPSSLALSFTPSFFLSLTLSHSFSLLLLFSHSLSHLESF